MCVCVWVGGGWVGRSKSGGVFLHAFSLTNPARNASPYCYQLAFSFQQIFRHYLINGTVFEEKVLDIDFVS
jgi:hypothetical protein